MKSRSETESMRVPWKEPLWLQQYRERNEAIVRQQPLQKSRHSNIALLDRLAEEPAGQGTIRLPKELESSGVKAFSWLEALDELEKELRFALEHEFPAKDQFEALVNARFNCGSVLLFDRLPSPDSILEWKTVFPSNAVAKTVVLVRATASPFQLLEKASGQNVRWNRTVLLDKNARAFFVSDFDFSNDSLLGLQGILKQGSELHCANAWTNGKTTRCRITHRLEDSSSVVQQDWNLGGKNDSLDLNLLLLHSGRSTKSRSVFKSVLDQHASSTFEGLIKIPPSGQQANALLEAHGLLLSPNASNNSVPELEIEADDVKATHSASVSHLDEEALFYLASRGLPEKEARRLVLMGFLESLVHELPEPFRQPLAQSLEKKWETINNS
jgi:Fe-S cluster assembly scaffold protein SufB